jgi:peptidoglycan/xylan/chitin deacetylase (PgdA/CDA1 family)
LSKSINTIKEHIPIKEIPEYVDTLMGNKFIELTKEQIRSYQIMSYVDLHQLASEHWEKSSLIDYGSHTHGHELLTKISNDEAHYTLKKSYEVLDEIVEKFSTNPYIFFCYPNGFFTEDHVAMCKEIDYGGAVTTKTGVVSTLTHPFKIPRIPVGQNTSFNMFKFCVSGLSTKLGFSSN